MKGKKRPLTEEELDAVNEMVYSGWNRKQAEKEVRKNSDINEEACLSNFILPSKKTTMNLKKELEDWTDFDGATFLIMQALNLIPEGSWEERVLDEHRKYIFWTDNPINNQMFNLLQTLVKTGVLEYDHDKLAYRWKKEFDPQTHDWSIE